jgi:hypothetical protein
LKPFGDMDQKAILPEHARQDLDGTPPQGLRQCESNGVTVFPAHARKQLHCGITVVCDKD